MTYIIAEPCIDIKDRSCVDVCPVDCIHEFGRMLIIDPEECIDCGACEPECPVEAIFPEDALPDKWEPFVKINYAYRAAPRRSTRSSTSTRPSTTSRIRPLDGQRKTVREDSGAKRHFRYARGLPVTSQRGGVMPQQAWSAKRERQYEHIKDSLEDQGTGEKKAKEIAARTVNKERARKGEAQTSSRLSREDISSGRRGGLRSGRAARRGATRDQLYEEAKSRGIKGRSKMTKAQLRRAVDGKKR